MGCRAKIKRWGPPEPGGEGVLKKERRSLSQATRHTGHLWLAGPLQEGRRARRGRQLGGPGWSHPLAPSTISLRLQTRTHRLSERLPVCTDSGPEFGSDFCDLVVKTESHFWDTSSSYFGGHASRVFIGSSKD